MENSNNKFLYAFDPKKHVFEKLSFWEKLNLFFVKKRYGVDEATGSGIISKAYKNRIYILGEFKPKIMSNEKFKLQTGQLYDTFLRLLVEGVASALCPDWIKNKTSQDIQDAKKIAEGHIGIMLPDILKQKGILNTEQAEEIINAEIARRYKAMNEEIGAVINKYIPE